MNLKFLIDENVDFQIVSFLKKKGIFIISVVKDKPGIQDEEVLEFARNEDAIIVTEDKDFGEWVFSHGYKIGVILLRYKFSECDAIMHSLLKVIEKYEVNLKGSFTVITSKKIRLRKI